MNTASMSEASKEAYSKQVEKLDEKIPVSAVSQRDGGSGRKLDYLEGQYVIQRMNEVFGHGNWAYDSLVTLIREDVLSKQNKFTKKEETTYSAHYFAKVKLLVKYANGETTEFADYGYGDGSDKVAPGKAHELAIKESVTDALKRCCKNLGLSMGLALYDKTKANVDYDESKSEEEQQASSEKSGKNKVSEIPEPKIGSVENLRNRVVTLGIEAQNKKVLTLDEIVAMLQSRYAAKKSGDLTKEQCEDFIKFMEGKLNV